MVTQGRRRKIHVRLNFAGGGTGRARLHDEAQDCETYRVASALSCPAWRSSFEDTHCF
jgi:hypothetical protein